MQVMEQIFQQFTPLRKGIATYQMPSFALEALLNVFLQFSHAKEYPHGQRLTSLIQKILSENLREYDIYFSEQEALIMSAGTYYAGFKQKQPDSTLIPEVIQKIWKQNDELQNRFPNLNDLTIVNNILTWARQQGREQFQEIAYMLDHLELFHKKGLDHPWDRSTIKNLPLEEAHFGAIGFDPKQTMAANAQIAEARHVRQYSFAQRVYKFLRGEPFH